jgi:hypothetical protein
MKSYRLSSLAFNLLVLSFIELVRALPAATTPSSASPSPTTVVVTATSDAATDEPGQTGSSDSLTKYCLHLTCGLTVRIVVLVVVFCLLPLAGLWFCCNRRSCCCLPCLPCVRPQDKPSYQNQRVILVPVNQFIPHDDPKLGYAVRVDTPSTSIDPPTPAPPMYQEMLMVAPPRAATPAGRTMEKNGGWKSLFRA